MNKNKKIGNYELKFNEQIHSWVLDLPSVSKLKNYLYPFNKNEIIQKIAQEILKTDKRFKNWEDCVAQANRYFELGVDKGNCTHSRLDFYIKTGEIKLCDHDIKSHETCFLNGKKWLDNLDINLELESEVAFFSDKYFGIADLIIKDKNKKTCQIIDWKTTSEFHEIEEEFQLYLEKRAFLLENSDWKVECLIINVNKNKNYELATDDLTEKLEQDLTKSLELFYENEKMEIF